MEILQKGDSAFPWISAQPLLEPLLNLHTASYMSIIMYLDTSNPWNKCPKRGLMTTGGQIPFGKDYRSLAVHLRAYTYLCSIGNTLFSDKSRQQNNQMIS